MAIKGTDRVELYDECSICGKWDDLTKWRELAYVCMSCAGVLDERAPYIQGKHHTNNEDTFLLIKKEVNHGQASAQVDSDQS